MRVKPDMASDQKTVLTLGGAAVAAVALEEYHALATGIPDLDRFHFRFWALLWSLWLSSSDLPAASQPKDGTSYRLGLAGAQAVMAVLHNEGAYSLGSDGLYPLGGDANTYGGPGQLTMALAQELGYDPSQGDLRAPGNERVAVKYLVLGLLRKMVVNGSNDLGQAVQAYNGSGPAAAQYLANADNFISQTYGGES